MTRSTSTNIITAPSRRRFLSQAAAVAAGGAALGMALPLPVSAGSPERVPDPIYEVIEAHKAAFTTWMGWIDRHSALEDELAADKCQSFFTAWESTVVETDDPRWIEAERETMRTSRLEIEAATMLVNILPTTLAGVVALLRYAVDADTDGEAWPTDLVDADGQSRTWQYLLTANLADILPELMPVTA